MNYHSNYPGGYYSQSNQGQNPGMMDVYDRNKMYSSSSNNHSDGQSLSGGGLSNVSGNGMQQSGDPMFMGQGSSGIMQPPAGPYYTGRTSQQYMGGAPSVGGMQGGNYPMNMMQGSGNVPTGDVFQGSVYPQPQHSMNTGRGYSMNQMNQMPDQSNPYDQGMGSMYGDERSGSIPRWSQGPGNMEGVGVNGQYSAPVHQVHHHQSLGVSSGNLNQEVPMHKITNMWAASSSGYTGIPDPVQVYQPPQLDQGYKSRNWNEGPVPIRSSRSGGPESNPKHSERYRDSDSRGGSHAERAGNNQKYEQKLESNKRRYSKSPERKSSRRISSRSRSRDKDPKKHHGSSKGGDWICPDCANINFSYREACNKCKKKKPSNPATISGSLFQFYHSHSHHHSSHHGGGSSSSTCKEESHFLADYDFVSFERNSQVRFQRLRLAMFWLCQHQFRAKVPVQPMREADFTRGQNSAGAEDDERPRKRVEASK